MQRGELYRVVHPPGDPRPARVYLVVSRDGFLDARHSTAMVVPVYSAFHGLETEVLVDETFGLKQSSSLHCDEVMSVRRTLLRDFVGLLPPEKMREVNRALAIALDIAPEDIEDL
ncbi:MAG: hypothetical protein AMXMBFR80_18870 [Dehalococcoidia bacterium]